MQQLHLVGFTTDLDQLILSVRKGAKSGSYLVPLDDRLLAEIAEAVRRRSDDQATGTAPPLELPPEVAAAARPASARVRPASSLTPREIQARLRSGRSIAEVAKEAGADEEWITKFASPVFAERAQIIRAARQLVFSKPRRGPSAESLGSSVRWNLADRGVRVTDEEFDACWDAYLVGDALWGVTFEAVTRGRQHQAVWEVDLREGEVFARNRAASDFGFVENARRRNPPTLATEPKATRTPSTRTPSTRAQAEAPARGTKSGARTSGRAASARGTKSAKSAKSAKSTARTTKRQPGKRAGGRGAPPAAPALALAREITSAPARAAAQAAASVRAPADVPNELAKHRMRLVQSERANERPAARPRPRPAPPPVAPPPGGPPRLADRPTGPPPAAPAPPRLREPEPLIDADVEVTEDVTTFETFDEEAARRRREERRRARAAAREANGSSGSSGASSGGERATGASDLDRNRDPDHDPNRDPNRDPDRDEGRVVTIRASRAGSAAAASDNNGRDQRERPDSRGGDVIVRGGTPALRPARPAVQPVQPRRRRFGRSR